MIQRIENKRWFVLVLAVAITAAFIVAPGCGDDDDDDDDDSIDLPDTQPERCEALVDLYIDQCADYDRDYYESLGWESPCLDDDYTHRMTSCLEKRFIEQEGSLQTRCDTAGSWCNPVRAGLFL